MTKIVRTISMLLVLFMLTIVLTSCDFFSDFEYTGDYPELYSVAISSILGARGYEIIEGAWRGGAGQPHVSILETDDFGRVLFLYGENEFIRRTADGGFRSANKNVYIIVQRVGGDYVYFYPHYNFTIRRQEVNSAIANYFDDIPVLSTDDLDTLKEANSWNQELSDDSAFERVRIVRQKEGGPLSNRELANAYSVIFPDVEAGRSTVASWMNYLRTDRYGRSVYSTWGTGMVFVAIVFQPDHSFNVETGTLEITDEINYQTELRLLMEANGWNMPWVEP